MGTFKARATFPLRTEVYSDGIKRYGISADGGEIDVAGFEARLAEVLAERTIPWADTASFGIFHRGAGMDYLVLGWWGNDNELFQSVSVRTAEGWVEDASRFSFCLWDMEVLWHERNSYVRWMYSGETNLEAYRQDFLSPIESIDSDPSSERLPFVRTAERIARSAHEGQFRYDGVTPYSEHPKAVAEKVNDDDEAVAVAWLHDVIEDTDWTAEQLEEAGIPKRVVAAVQLLTKSGEGTYLEYLERVAASPLARKVKIADMLSNLADSPKPHQVRKYAIGLERLTRD